MYRKLSRRQQEARARKLEAMRRGKDCARRGGESYPQGRNTGERCAETA